MRPYGPSEGLSRAHRPMSLHGQVIPDVPRHGSERAQTAPVTAETVCEELMVPPGISTGQ